MNQLIGKTEDPHGSFDPACLSVMEPLLRPDAGDYSCNSSSASSICFMCILCNTDELLASSNELEREQTDTCRPLLPSVCLMVPILRPLQGRDRTCAVVAVWRCFIGCSIIPSETMQK